MNYNEFIVQYSLGTLSFGRLKKLAYSTDDERILKILSENNDWMVRYNVTLNPKSPKKIIYNLCNDNDWWVSSTAFRMKRIYISVPYAPLLVRETGRST